MQENQNNAKPILIIRLPFDITVEEKDRIIESVKAETENEYHVIIYSDIINIKEMRAEVLNGQYSEDERKTLEEVINEIREQQRKTA